MRKTYRILADIIAIDVVIQAMAIVFGVAGLFKWIDDGATLDSAVVESWEDNPPDFTGAIGHFIHAMNGTFLIPLLGILLLIVSFFAKVDGAVKWAAIVVVSIVVQVAAGILAADVPAIGLIHGLNAFVLFGAALMAARNAKVPTVARVDTGAHTL
jgi:heme A synthase